MNARSSIEAELVAVDDTIGPLEWTRCFIEAQGITVQDNMMCRDN